MLNIQIPELEHKYISLYDTLELYEADKENYEEVHYSIVKSDQATDSNYSLFQYSTRTTNNDNEVMAKYWSFETIDLWAGLKIIWGYFGWQETTIELLGETLIGGNFYNTGKNMTTVLSIPDGNTLLHIDNFTNNLYEDRRSNIIEIQEFDTSNIKSALKFIYQSASNNCTLKQLEWNALLRGEFNYVKPIGDMHFDNIRYLLLFVQNDVNYYAPNVEYETFNRIIPYRSVINFGGNQAQVNNSICSSFGLTLQESDYSGSCTINIDIPKSNKTKYRRIIYNKDDFTFTKNSSYSEYTATLNLERTSSFFDDGAIITVNLTDLNDYADNICNLFNGFTGIVTNLNLTLNDSYRDYNYGISSCKFSSLPITLIRGEDKCNIIYYRCTFIGDIEIDLYSDYVEGNPITSNKRELFDECYLTDVTSLSLLHLDKVDNLTIDGTVSPDFIWNIPFSDDVIYKQVRLQLSRLTKLMDGFHINVLGNYYLSRIDIFTISNIEYSNIDCYINIIPSLQKQSLYLRLLCANSSSTKNMKLYFNKNQIDVFEYNLVNVEELSTVYVHLPDLAYVIGSSNTTIDLTTLNALDLFTYMDDEGIKHSYVEQLDISLGHTPTYTVKANVEHLLLGSASGIVDINIRNAENLNLSEFFQSIFDVNIDNMLVLRSSLTLLRTLYNTLTSEQLSLLTSYFYTINIIDT